MDIQQILARLTVTMSVAAAATLVGCNSKSDQANGVANRNVRSPTADRPHVESSRPEDHFAVARRNLLIRDFDAAAEAAYSALLQDPENADAILLAGEAEAARGNHQVAADLAGSIELGSRLGRRAVELRYRQLIKLKQWSAAADVIVEALRQINDVPEWRHEAWGLLNRVGRREEASLQAEALCREGQATLPELHSLIRRTRAFPFELKEGEDPAQYFEPGLGMARWHFSRKQYDQAFKELSAEKERGFDSAAACALYGRLLAETQRFEQFPAWHSMCDDPVRELGDYWAALGVYFYDVQRYEAAARALMESVYRNPTDRVSLQRLSKVFHSLQRPDDGFAYRQRGINVSDTERLSDAILEQDDASVRLSLTKELAALGRPFETLQWTLTLATAGSVEQAQIQRQLADYRASTRTSAMARESSLIGIPINDFRIGDAIDLLASPHPQLSAPAEGAPLLAQPRLVNVATERGIDFRWERDLEFDESIIPIHESVGGGIAVLDYDLDGWPDVYLAQGSGDPPTDRCTRSNVLLRNVDARFAGVTVDAGAEDHNYASGIAAGDINQDGFADLWLGSLGRNRLLINNGDGTFQDITDRLGPCEDRFTSSLAIGDINGDALPDLFETNYIAMEGGFVVPEIDTNGLPEMPGPLSHYAASDRWWENVGDGSFHLREITRDVDLPGTSLGIIVTDLDSDGSNDVFIGNDVRPNHLLVHTGDNQFINVADAKGIANGFRGIPNGCMGIATGDFNRDGAIDLHVTNFNEESANLYIQTPGGLFTDAAIRYGIDQYSFPMVGFGTKAIDFDRNGWLDLIVTNGHIFDTRMFGEELFQMPPQLMMRIGSRFELIEMDDPSGYWQGNYLGRAMASLDFDRDGSVDIIVGHLDTPVALLHNQTETDGNWIQLELVGTKSERDAVGARVVVTAGGEQFTHWITAGDGYLCTDEPVLDVALGVDREVERVVIYWPATEKQTFHRPKHGRRYLVIEGEPDLVAR